ncbi:MAG TPA: transposase [Fimbriimonas sp.]|nr:transposase [Fimbriimonas sp.]
MEEAHFSSRGYLPHLHVPGGTQFITWRLKDSMPPGLYEKWKAELQDDFDTKRKLQSRVEQYIDLGKGAAVLKRPELARVVLEDLLAGSGGHYLTKAAVIMPNHVHAVITLNGDASLGRVMNLLKGRTARAINNVLGKRGSLWQEDYFDRLVRGPDHFEKCVHYVHWNPVKAGLAEDPRWFAHSTASEYWTEKFLRPEGRHPEAA